MLCKLKSGYVRIRASGWFLNFKEGTSFEMGIQFGSRHLNWCLSFVYGLNKGLERKRLWHDLVAAKGLVGSIKQG
jgi:hypothetical protein